VAGATICGMGRSSTRPVSRLAKERALLVVPRSMPTE
jgi:hypothetical protein